MTDSKRSVELEHLIIEFEDWCHKNRSKDVNEFCDEKGLSADFADELKSIFQMGNLVDDMLEVGNDAEATDAVDGMIGNYRLEKRLGVGGMGTVWLAHQAHPVKRQVAVKLIRADRISEAAVKRFEREKQALAMMSHSHVATVYDAGTSEDDRPYIAMEFVDGRPITEYCEDRQLPLPKRLGLFLQLCSAIQHAHQNGLLHRDIKPSNVLVTEIDGAPSVKVIDFGLVRPDEDWDPTVTQPEVIVGTPLWMSPEQARGFRGDATTEEAKATVDTRADIYSLGVILYQVLTESTPIATSYYEKATKLELLKTIQDETPELPSSRVEKMRFKSGKESTPVSSWASALRNELDWVTMRALEKDRDRRYPTVAAFAEDVQNYLQNEPVNARPPSLNYRLKKLAQRHKAATFAAVTIFGLVVLASVGFAWLAANARKAEQRKGKTMEIIGQMLVAFNPSVDGAKFNEAQLKVFNDFREVMDDDDYSEAPQLEAEFREFLADAYSGSAEYESAVEQYEKVVDIYSKIPNADPRRLIGAKLKLAKEHNWHWDMVKAMTLSKECYEESIQRLGEKDELTISARSLSNLSSIQNEDLDEIVADLKETIELAKNELGETHQVTIEAVGALGAAYYDNLKTAEAAEQFGVALELAEEMLGPNDRRTMELKINKLSIESRNRSPEFEQRLDELLADSSEKFGPGHLFTLRLGQKRAYLDRSRGDYEAAQTQFAELLKTCCENYNEKHRLALFLRTSQADTHYLAARNGPRASRESELDSALAILRELAKDYSALAGNESLGFLQANSLMARVLKEQRKFDEALKLSDQYYPVAEEHLGYGAQTTQRFVGVRLVCLFELGKQQQSVKERIGHYHRSLEELEQPSAVTADFAMNIADTGVQLGDRQDSAKFYQLGHEIFLELNGPGDDSSVMSLFFLQNEQSFAKQFEAAEQSARKLISILPEKFTNRGMVLRAAQVTLGEALCEQGKFEEGKTFLEKAMKPAPMGPEKLFELRAKGAMALCQIADGKKENAIRSLTEAKEALEANSAMGMPHILWFSDRCNEKLEELAKKTP